MFSMFVKNKGKSSASKAKERLQIIVAHERGRGDRPSYMPELEAELLKVIRKYVEIDPGQVSVSMDNSDDISVLELNVSLK